MVTTLAWIGALVVAGYLIKILAQAIRDSGLEEFSFKFRFKTTEKADKQLKPVSQRKRIER
jgi:hypothetical protein